MTSSSVLDRAPVPPAAPSTTGPDDGVGRDGSGPGASRARLLPVLLAVLLGAVLLGSSASWLTARFGEDHEGRNAAVWGAESRAIRTEGVIESRFGGLAQGRAYANHPPGIVAQTTLAELVAGEHRVVTRSPAWIGSIVAIGLLALLLIDAGLPSPAVVAGVVVACTSGMFLVYGTMLDTPVTSLPFSLLVLVLCQRAVQDRPPPWWAFALAGFGAAVAGWPSICFAVFGGGWLALAALRRRSARPATLALAVGGAVGTVLTFSWIWWVYGSLSGFRDNAQYRAADVTWGRALGRQVQFLGDLLPLAVLIGGLGLLVALAGRRHRALAIVTLVPVLGYAAAFRGAAEMHDYWNFALVVPLALGVAVAAERLTHAIEPRFGARAGTVVVVLAVAVGLVSVAMPSDAETALRGGLRTPELLDVAVANAPADGPVVAYVSAGGARSPWIRYESGREALPLDDFEALDELARTQPDFPVLVVAASPTPAVRDAISATALRIEYPWAVLRAEDASAAYALRPDA